MREEELRRTVAREVGDTSHLFKYLILYFCANVLFSTFQVWTAREGLGRAGDSLRRITFTLDTLEQGFGQVTKGDITQGK